MPLKTHQAAGLAVIFLFSLGFFVGLTKTAQTAEPAAATIHRTAPADRPDIINSLDEMPDQAVRPALVLEGGEAGSILGKEVRSATDEKLGRIIDVVVDRRGAARAAVIDFGGFLGVGSRRIAVAWDILMFSGSASGEDRITVQTTRDRLNTAPEFRDGKPITVLGARDLATGTQLTSRTPEQ